MKMQENQDQEKNFKLDTTSESAQAPKGKSIILSVTMGLMLDYMLVTVIIPIIPDILYNIENKNDIFHYDTTGSATTNETIIASSDKQLPILLHSPPELAFVPGFPSSQPDVQ